MLRPQDSSTREMKRLDGLWSFRLDGNKKGVFTPDRRPKPAAFALRRRWRAKV